MLIVIDGPAGSGKSSVSKMIAKKLKINYLDTGSMYRMITYYFLEKKYPLNNNSFQKHLDEITITYKNNVLLLNGKDVSTSLRQTRITDNISVIAANKLVREKLVKLQREIVQQGNFILDGRDLGTYVFPECKNKFYLTASVNERARRRYFQNKKLNIKSDIEEIKKSIKKRDYEDKNRKIGPLKKAPDAVVIDTNKLHQNQVVNRIIKHLNEE